MESRAAWTTEIRDAFESVASSVAALADLVDEGANSAWSCDADPLRKLADDCLGLLTEIPRLEARTAALKVRATATYVEATSAIAPPAASPQEMTAQEMSLVAEVACVLTVSERSAGALLAESRALTTSLPRTLFALQSGTISWQHARIMIDETASLDAAGASSLESHFLNPDAVNAARGCPAGDLVPSRFRAKTRTWRERHHPVSIEKRHAATALDRRLEYTPDRDGMAWLSAYLPADTAAGIWNRTTTAARALQGPTEPRTLTQLRTDIAAIWLLTTGAAETAGAPETVYGTASTATVPSSGGAADGMASASAALARGALARGASTRGALARGASTRGALAGAPDATGQSAGAPCGPVPTPAAQVLVTVPVFSLMSLTDEPAILDGYGPIPASMARTLVADGATSFLRVLTDPSTGAPLEIGRTSYRIPTAMRQWLRLRDGKCPFPGCTNQSLDNEADHLLAWEHGGTTGISNLGQPCRKHHKLKHATQWTPSDASLNSPPGWISPAGRHYPSEHQDWEPPHRPDQLLHVQKNDTPDRTPDYSLPEDPLPDAAWAGVHLDEPRRDWAGWQAA
jgi:hypothetical protein